MNFKSVSIGRRTRKVQSTHDERHGKVVGDESGRIPVVADEVLEPAEEADHERHDECVPASEGLQTIHQRPLAHTQRIEAYR